MSTRDPTISHIFFADDTLIFLKADKANCNNLSRLLATYCLASGQAVNLQKSCVFFSANTPMDLAADIGRSWHSGGFSPWFLSWSSCHLGPFQIPWSRLYERSFAGENSGVEKVYALSGRQRSDDKGCCPSHTGIPDEFI
ncbi:hypothetical protein ACFX2I_045229 [Malus domestica]